MKSRMTRLARGAQTPPPKAEKLPIDAWNDLYEANPEVVQKTFSDCHQKFVPFRPLKPIQVRPAWLPAQPNSTGC